MQSIPKEHIQAFITIYQDEFQETLSFHQAQTKATHLLDFFMLFLHDS